MQDQRLSSRSSEGVREDSFQQYYGQLSFIHEGMQLRRLKYPYMEDSVSHFKQGIQWLYSISTLAKFPFHFMLNVFMQEWLSQNGFCEPFVVFTLCLVSAFTIIAGI